MMLRVHSNLALSPKLGPQFAPKLSAFLRQQETLDHYVVHSIHKKKDRPFAHESIITDNEIKTVHDFY